jgi:hypothetical protein
LRFLAVSQTFTVAHGAFVGTAPATPPCASTAAAISDRATGSRRMPLDPRATPPKPRHTRALAELSATAASL